MASQEYILCIDIGADSIKASEFICTSANVELNQFAYLEYTNDADDASAFESMLAALKEIITTKQFLAKDVYLSLSGQNALIPFIKIPAMSTDPQKIRELVAYEASSRIPYPLNEVVWDYQLIDNQAGADEIDAMLVSVKNDEVVRITDTVESTGKKVRSIEVSPTAIYNAARANGIGENQCEMILNIGGKSSTLVFVDGARFFVRSIPVAGNTITQQIAKEFNMSFAEADEIKRRHGFVALGGAYEDPESEMSATVSKIVRNVMTRLHGEINRSINVYRASQHGRKPEKLYLAGGSSIMAFTPRFFIEKLRIPVDYFNPFKIIPIGANVDREQLQELAHLYGETIGLALRHFRSTPIEISLIPETVKKQNAMRMKNPFFYATAVSLLVYLGITFWAMDSQTSDIQEKSSKVSSVLLTKMKNQQTVENAKTQLRNGEAQFNIVNDLVTNRNEFLTVFNMVQDKVDEFNNNPKYKQKGIQTWLTEVSFSKEDPQKPGKEQKAVAPVPGKRRGRRGAQNQARSAGSEMKYGEEKWVTLAGYAVVSRGDVMGPIVGLTETFLKNDAWNQLDANHWKCLNCGHIENASSAPELCPGCKKTPKALVKMTKNELDAFLADPSLIGDTNVSPFKFPLRLNVDDPQQTQEQNTQGE